MITKINIENIIRKVQIELEKQKEAKNNIEYSNVVLYGEEHIYCLYEQCFEYEQIKSINFINQDNITEKRLAEMLGNIEMPLLLILPQKPGKYESLKKTLTNYGIRSILLMDSFILTNHINEIINNIECIVDEKSIFTYCNLILSRISGDKINKDVYEKNQYFSIAEFNVTNINEIFVDAGAFVGDTVERYIFKRFSSFRKIYAFEPDNKNYIALCKRRERLCAEWALDNNKIECVNGGLGDITEAAVLNSNGNGSSYVKFNDINTINLSKIYSLDDYLKNEHVSFIKADIEGYELIMLKGACKLISKCKPLLAISIYHNPADMYRIQSYICKMHLGYKFDIRHHSFGYYDTVLYAYVD